MEWLGTLKSVIGIVAIVLIVFFIWAAVDDFNKDHDKD